MSNDRVILDEILRQKRDELFPVLSPSDFFEFYTAEQVLKNFDLSYDEIESGIVGGGLDGGIDGIYLLVNGELVREDSDLAHLKKNITIDLIIIQSKTSPGFQETPVERFITFSGDLLDLSKNTTEMREVYNSDVVEKIEKFRQTQQQLASKFPSLRIVYHYVSRGDNPELGTTRKVENLRGVVSNFFPRADFEFNFIGATELLDLSRQSPTSTLTLPLAENPVSSGQDIGYICLVYLRDFYQFISDESGNLKRYIFEANVRDYQGKNQVNTEIQETLSSPGGEDFWWLNNGVTIIASKATTSAKSLIVEDPQIVNGLQTSSEIYAFFSQSPLSDERKLLVKVVAPTNPQSIDRIIKASNSQTPVQAASLRATDKIHRDIEEYFHPHGLFYDRRKNYYKNLGRARNKIVGIPHLAQAVMSICLQRPDSARARPSSLLKKDDDYTMIFTEQHPIHSYFVCAEIQRLVEDYLKLDSSAIAIKDRNNIRFYTSLLVAARIAGNFHLNAATVSRLDPYLATSQLIAECVGLVNHEYVQLGGDDRVAKGTELLLAVKAIPQPSAV